MRSMTRLAMGATLAVAVSLAMLLALLLFLLLSLLCSLLRDNRHSRNNDVEAEPPPEQHPAGPLAFPFYGHGVLKAPTKYLLSVPNLEAASAKQASPFPAQSHRHGDDFVSISNPIYDGTQGDVDGGTPFATCFEGGDMEECSPPLKLMKKLPAVLPKSCSLFEEQRSLAASTETNRPSSSSSSNSLCSPPSW